jgi:hypothetical protein
MYNSEQHLGPSNSKPGGGGNLSGKSTPLTPLSPLGGAGKASVEDMSDDISNGGGSVKQKKTRGQ